MALSTTATRERARSGVASLAHGPSARPLILVSVAYTIVLLTLAAPDRGLAWDESVYFSQIDPRAPAAFFSAPRSRGVSFLGAPVSLFTSNPLALRVFLAVLAGLALYASFTVWRRLVGDRTTALAALLFSTLWVTVAYGSQVMPNLWVAFGAVAAVGHFLRAVGDRPRPAHHAGLACAIAWVALTRANDGVLLAVPLLAATVSVRAWRRPRVAVALLVGLGAGLAQWVTEAYVRFGGVGERLADSSRVEGGMRLGWNVANAARSANGPSLCRPCTVGSGPAVLDLWWAAIPVLAVLALVLAARLGGRGRLATTVLPMVCALAVSFSYLFLISYSAPRFFLPAYALLSLPIAATLTRGWARVRARPTLARRCAAALVVAVLCGDTTAQLLIAHHQIAGSVRTDARYAALAGAVGRLGVRPPCLVAGPGNRQPVAYDARCASSAASDLASHTSPPSGSDLLSAARRESVVLLTAPGQPAPAYAAHWRRAALTGSPLVTGWSAYLPPRR